jgi:aspartate kinase
VVPYSDLVVQKYGGTSLATPEMIKRVAGRVLHTLESGRPVLVVVSAMGDSTDRLMDLAHAVARKPSRRELDMLLTAGERISMALLAMALNDAGQEAISFTGSQSGIVTDTRHTKARILQIRADRIREEIEKGKVVIVAGFQGVSREREVTTLGRGGSDTSAVALSSFLGASACEIYSDVDGLYTADPRLVPEARLVPRCSHEEILELASLGARILHVHSARLARDRSVPLVLRGTFSSSPGTLVGRAREGDAPLCGLTAHRDLGLVELRGEAVTERCARLIEALENERATWAHPVAGGGDSEDALLLALDEGELSRARAWLRRKAQREGLALRSIPDMGSVSLVGDGCGSSREVRSTLDGLLAEERIPWKTMDVRPGSITILLERGRVPGALRGLHRRLEAIGFIEG